MAGVLLLGLLSTIGYFLIYKKIFKGKKKPRARELILASLFIGYLIMLIGITILGREENFKGSINMDFLSSYRHAWNSFALIIWQQLIFNIIMFIPLGILLPIMNRKFQKLIWTLLLALATTGSIEVFQLLTGRGVFELDDMFNNILGALIGYGITMAFMTLFKRDKRKPKKILLYLLPLIFTIGGFLGIFSYYYLKDYGNLTIAYSYRIKMDGIEVRTDRELSKERPKVPIYKAQGYNSESAKEFAQDFFQRLGLDTDKMEIDQYNDNAIYWINGINTHNLWINYKDGTYDYTDFSSLDSEEANIDEEGLKKALEKFSILVAEESVFSKDANHGYKWELERSQDGDKLIEGYISCRYYEDGNIKNINYNISQYEKVRDLKIKTEKEAYEEILKGKFVNYNLKKDTALIEIIDVKLGYFLDSKGYYQPVYSFDTLIDGVNQRIVIPALR